eukprot:gene17657-23244_t
MNPSDSKNIEIKINEIKKDNKFDKIIENNRENALNSNQIDTNHLSRSIDNNRVLSLVSEDKGLFIDGSSLTDVCLNTIEILSKNKEINKIASVILIARNEEPVDVIRSVLSIVKNSQQRLSEIVLIDDLSNNKISEWKQWSEVFDSNPYLKSILRIQRTTSRLGVAGAKHFGAKLASKPSDYHVTPNVFVFVDAHVIVSDNWLLPLINTLNSNSNSIVYPAIDILVQQDGYIGVLKSDNVIGSFDWSLAFRWSDPDPSRFSLLPSQTDENAVVTSPAAPGILAISKEYYESIGGFDSELGAWGQDSVELSLRVWLCGGVVIRQPCSRVAHKYKQLRNDAAVGNGINQREVDRNIVSLADRYMRPRHHETVYQARFTGRVPYSVEISASDRFSKSLHGVEKFSKDECLSIDWFLQEVFSGLLVDEKEVLLAYRLHLGSNYLTESLKSLIYQYTKDSNVVFNDVEVGRLTAKSRTKDEVAIQSLHDGYIPKKVPYTHPNIYLDNIVMLGSPDNHDLKKTDNEIQKKAEHIEISLGKTIETDEHEVHANRVRETLECLDEPILLSNGLTSCEDRIQLATSCTDNKSYMMFGCPKTCGLCGEDGKICFDFYENKCRQWKSDGLCEDETQRDIMSHVCRKSCNLCKASSNKSKFLSTINPTDSPIQESEQVNIDQGNIVDFDHNKPPLIPDPLPDLSLPEGSDIVDPYVAQRQFKEGTLPDPTFTSSGACELNERPDGELLARIEIHKDVESYNTAYRIFCGVYTMESSHSTNVQATRETWGKKCDGFVAFSTKDDPNIPSVNITHEGPELYDNMWQKSRSIWKYIAKNFKNNFDYFLLGGDDMFYIIENLRYYLGSSEVIDLKEKGKGMFLGRRFFPPKQKVFNSGGAGYIIDRVSLEVLENNIDTPKCFPHQRGFWEDVNIANCLKVSAEILPIDTRDSSERERFHPFTPGSHLTYRIPQGNNDWYPKYNPNLKEGFDCCSSDSISFHYAKHEKLRQLFTYLYHCDNKLQSNNFGLK